MSAPHPTFANALEGFRATVPANLPKTVKPSEDAAWNAIRAEGERYENAVGRLTATARIILDSMSIADQPGLHARLRSDLAAVDACNGGMQA